MENIIEEYGQLIVLAVIVIVALLAYGGYTYYMKQQNIKDVNNNLNNNNLNNNNSKQAQGSKIAQGKQAQGKQAQGKQAQGKQSILAFIPSNEFKGERRGYKFTQGPKGLGYYLDKK